MKFLLAAILSLQAGAALADDVIWRTQWRPENPGGGAKGVCDIAPAIDGGAFVAFYYQQPGKGGGDVGSIAKFSSSGELQWHRSGIAGAGMLLEPDSVGNLYVSARGGPGFTAKYSAGGTLQWSLHFQSNSTVMDMALDADGNCYILRSNYTLQGFYSDMIKVNPDGGAVWTRSIAAEQVFGYLEWDSEGNLACFINFRDGSPSQMIVYDVMGNVVRSFVLMTEYVDSDASVAFGPENELYYAYPLRRLNEDGTAGWVRVLNGAEVECDANRVYTTDGSTAYFLDRTNGFTLWSEAIPENRYPNFRHPEPSLDGLGNYWLVRGEENSDNAVPVRLKTSGLLSVVYPISGDARLAVGDASDMYFLAKPGNFGQVNSLVISKLRNGIDHDSAQLVRGRTTENSHYAIMHS
nr:hypothetical protein [Armatimonadota bacterium]